MSPKHATKDGNLRESPFSRSSCHVFNKLSSKKKKDRKDIEEKLLFPFPERTKSLLMHENMMKLAWKRIVLPSKRGTDLMERNNSEGQEKVSTLEDKNTLAMKREFVVSDQYLLKYEICFGNMEKQLLY